MQRTLQPEWLDSLAPTDPAALHNRRDLRITNRIMGNHRWVARTLSRRGKPGCPVLEIGSGTGELGRRLHAAGLPADGLDLWPRPSDWPAERSWHQADLLTFDSYAAYPVVVGNLIFHQFDAAQLGAVGQRLRAAAELIVACEPVRRPLSQTLFRSVAPLLGAHPVSLHDGVVSIAAGFRDDELPRLLGLAPAEWQWSCHSTWLGAYRMVAVRRSS